ncbi:DUF6636 domain-containing protein [Jannaschia pohangensis]|uniref:Uncharacterized protein n=1 Tax=Jannaschia pohangensis TaxID=390807 RepID=A0A1I3JBC5_9RHOB|nr:DUF6636 domain-containing protein [Jannaschia pohangensis]SFI57542.1 hypothetical protein SAMN04488095_1272 [Jannaschia pohangensis]
MTRLTHALAVALGLLFGAGAEARAAGFTSPSGNILCYLDVLSDLPFDEMPLVCLVFEAEWDLPPDYGDDDPTCDFDRTRTILLRPGQPATARWTCHGDVFWPAPLGAISYGSEWSLADYTCAMATDGVRCGNSAGNGFQVRRSSVTLN